MENSKRLIREIVISNLGVIESTKIELGDGFNVITGETGAGKTMILTGLGLLAGEKADSDFIRSGAEKLSVSAIVHIDGAPTTNLAELITEHEPEMESGELVLARSVTRDGKNRAQVGGLSATAGLLSKFANEFYAVHGQGSNQKLLSNTYQRRLVDSSDEKLSLKCDELRSGVLQLKEQIKEMAALKKSLLDRDATKMKLSTFQTDFKRISLKAGELEDLEARIQRLDSVEEWHVALSGALNALDDEETGALSSISRAIRSLTPISESMESMRQLSARFTDAKNELSDLRNEIGLLLRELEGEPGELDQLRERKASILAFVKKHASHLAPDLEQHAQIEALIKYGTSVEKLLKNLDGGDERLDQMRSEIEKVFRHLCDLAREVSTMRQTVAKRVESAVTSELQVLGLAGSRFSIELSNLPVEKPEELRLEGIDEITFKFAAHQSVTPHSLSKGISGGELSRLMLAIELALVSDRDISTIVFDEVDSGIGGETANTVGQRLAKLAENRQIIVVTHLPQVAVWAKQHFVITKNADNDFVQSSVEVVTGDARVREIARMLSGELEDEAAILHAGALLKHATLV